MVSQVPEYRTECFPFRKDWGWGDRICLIGRLPEGGGISARRSMGKERHVDGAAGGSHWTLVRLVSPHPSLYALDAHYMARLH